MTSRIRYYAELEHLLWPENLRESGLKIEFEGHIVDLYQRILEFRIKTVLRSFRRWLLSTSRDIFRYENWEQMVSKIKVLEQIIREDSNTLNTVTSRGKVHDISKTAEHHYADMRSLLLVAEEQLAEQRRTKHVRYLVHEYRLTVT